MNPYEIKNTKNKMKSIAQENAELIKREAKYVLKLNEMIKDFEELRESILENILNAETETEELLSKSANTQIKYTLKQLKTLRNG